MVAPHLRAWVAMASGQDEDGQAKTALSAEPARIWTRLRPRVVAFLATLGGIPVDNLGVLMRSHVRIDGASRMLTSPSAVGPARAAYLPRLVGDSGDAALVLSVRGDPCADVRLGAIRAPGAIGELSAASGVVRALPTHGQIGLLAAVEADALLAMGPETGPGRQIASMSQDPAVPPWWRHRGWWASLPGNRQVRGTMTRRGFGHDAPAVATLSGDV
jgi:hypothetical protein